MNTPQPAHNEVDRILAGLEVQASILDGFACAICGRRTGPMIPIGQGPRGQIFVHEECREYSPERSS